MSKDRFVKISKDGSLIASRVLIAESFMTRLVGLMFGTSPGDKDGLFFEGTTSIHTHFMRYPLDVVFLNKEDEVVKVIKEMKPWRMTRPYFKASKAFEIVGGTLKLDLKPGDRLVIKCIN